MNRAYDGIRHAKEIVSNFFAKRCIGIFFLSYISATLNANEIDNSQLKLDSPSAASYLSDKDIAKKSDSFLKTLRSELNKLLKDIDSSKPAKAPVSELCEMAYNALFDTDTGGFTNPPFFDKDKTNAAVHIHLLVRQIPIV